jgi:preprotein translocase subunit SecB
MSMTNGGDGRGQGPTPPPGPMPSGAPGQAANTPQFNVLAQYIKDLSFENPNAPRSLSPTQQPTATLRVDVVANPMSPTDFEVELKLDGKTEVTGSLVFGFELVFAGLFRLQNIPQESIGPLLMIECPRLLFPFAREIVATTVRNGGFPQLLIEPIDFVTLYQQKMMQTQSPQTAAPTP